MQIEVNFLVSIDGQPRGIAKDRRGVESVIESYKSDVDYIYQVDKDLNNYLLKRLANMAEGSSFYLTYEYREYGSSDNRRPTHREERNFKVTRFLVR